MSGFPETQASGFDAYSTELESLLASPTYSPSTHAADAQGEDQKAWSSVIRFMYNFVPRAHTT